MRIVMLIVGFVLGVAAAVGYSVLVRVPPEAVRPRPLPHNPAVTVTLGDAVVDEIVRVAVKNANVEAAPQHVRSILENDTIVVTGDVDVLGQSRPAKAVLRPVLRDGVLRMEVVETTVGTLPVPMVEQQLEKELDARMRSLMTGLPVKLTGVQTQARQGVTVTGELAPGAVEEAVTTVVGSGSATDAAAGSATGSAAGSAADPWAGSAAASATATGSGSGSSAAGSAVPAGP